MRHRENKRLRYMRKRMFSYRGFLYWFENVFIEINTKFVCTQVIADGKLLQARVHIFSKLRECTVKLCCIHGNMAVQRSLLQTCVWHCSCFSAQRTALVILYPWNDTVGVEQVTAASHTEDSVWLPHGLQANGAGFSTAELIRGGWRSQIIGALAFQDPGHQGMLLVEEKRHHNVLGVCIQASKDYYIRKRVYRERMSIYTKTYLHLCKTL